MRGRVQRTGVCAALGWSTQLPSTCASLTPQRRAENELLKQQTLQTEAAAKASFTSRAHAEVEPPEELSDLEALMRAK